jgi:ABC-type nickel/cobalt efflux system permease component RcnA
MYPPQKLSQPVTQPLPDLPASRLLVGLGVASIVFAGLIGAGLSTAVLLLAARSLREYEKRPSRWNKVSAKRIRTARTLAIVGACVSALVLFFLLVYVIVEWDSVQGYF